MKLYKVKKLKVIEVECESFLYLKKDNNGDVIYENTHFASEEEAYNKAITECDAGMSLIARDIESLTKELERLKNELTKYAVAKNNLTKKPRRIRISKTIKE